MDKQAEDKKMRQINTTGLWLKAEESSDAGSLHTYLLIMQFGWTSIASLTEVVLKEPKMRHSFTIEGNIFNCNLGGWNDKNSIKKKQRKKLNPNTYICLTCFEESWKREGSDSEAEQQHLTAGKLKLAWLPQPHNLCHPPVWGTCPTSAAVQNGRVKIK